MSGDNPEIKAVVTYASMHKLGSSQNQPWLSIRSARLLGCTVMLTACSSPQPAPLPAQEITLTGRIQNWNSGLYTNVLDAYTDATIGVDESASIQSDGSFTYSPRHEGNAQRLMSMYKPCNPDFVVSSSYVQSPAVLPVDFLGLSIRNRAENVEFEVYGTPANSSESKMVYMWSDVDGTIKGSLHCKQPSSESTDNYNVTLHRGWNVLLQTDKRILSDPAFIVREFNLQSVPIDTPTAWHIQ